MGRKKNESNELINNDIKEKEKTKKIIKSKNIKDDIINNITESKKIIKEEEKEKKPKKKKKVIEIVEPLHLNTKDYWIGESVKLKEYHRGIPKGIILKIIEPPLGQRNDFMSIWVKYNNNKINILQAFVFYIR